MRRRQFITLVGGAAAIWPLAVQAQQASRINKIFRVGVLANEKWPPLKGLQDGLRDLGYVEGQNLELVQRYAEGQPARYFGSGPGVFADADPCSAHLADDSAYDDVRLAAGNDCRVLRLPFVVASKRLFSRWPADDFHAPGLNGFRFRLGRLGVRWNQSGDWQIAPDILDGGHLNQVSLGSGRPFFNRTTGHNPYIRPRFLRKRPTAAKPIVNTSR